MSSLQGKYNIEAFAQELEVDLERVVPLFAGYIEEMKEEVKALKGYLEKKDWNMLEKTIHNIKGVSANLNIEDVYKESAIFNGRLKKGMNDDAGDYVQQIISLIHGAEIEIRRFFREKGFDV
jgi:HPt (histidine-containing phosphotransfer) domain-containing protein